MTNERSSIIPTASDLGNAANKYADEACPPLSPKFQRMLTREWQDTREAFVAGGLWMYERLVRIRDEEAKKNE